MKRTPRARKKRTPKTTGGESGAMLSLLAQMEDTEDTDLAQAQDIAWDAWDTGGKRKRLSLARKALKISPLCADAYVILAEDARTTEDALALCRAGVEAGEKALGRNAFRDDVGHFWGILETRPYMRARHGLAMRLWKTGAHDEAIAHYRALLRLNPNDNQGIRYLLLDCHLILGRDDDAQKLVRRYRNDGATEWLWSVALLGFRREGDTQNVRQALQRAASENRYVRDYLLGRKKIPQTLSAYVSWGSKEEAQSYVGHSGAEAWAAASGAIAWAEKVLG
ncbi:MAG TPA: tetratricopeptide repeat protein [Rhizomicrobium sp.]